jgi:cell division protein FtsI (penicillin-binding protein 3)
MSATDQAQKPVEPWRRRFIRALLYGSDVDRTVKARARVGLAVIAFALIYGIIAGRLITFAATSDGHNARRTAGQDAVGTARPDILDRSGRVLATDVRSPSLFGEPHRIIDIDEAVELLTAVLPDHNAAELRERLAAKRWFVLLLR